MTTPNTDRPEHQQAATENAFQTNAPTQDQPDRSAHHAPEHALDHSPDLPATPGLAEPDQHTVDTASKALRGELSGEETFRFLTDRQHTGRLSPTQRTALEQAGTAEPLPTARLITMAQALDYSANDAADRLEAQASAQEETQALATRARQESAFIILAKSEFNRDYNPWLQYEDQLAGTTENDPRTQDTLRDIVAHRLHIMAQNPATMPQKLDALHEDLINLETRILPVWFNPETMAIPPEESQKNTNWLVPRLPYAMTHEDATSYLKIQLTAHGVGTTGDINPNIFAAAVLDPHIDAELAAEWRTSPTTYNRPPRNPTPSEPWEDPSSHTTATYAWLIRDSMDENWLPRHIWLASPIELEQEAREKAHRLAATAVFLKDLAENAHAPAFKLTSHPGYNPRFTWDTPHEATWLEVMATTDNGQDITPLWTESLLIEKHISDTILPPAGSDGNLDHDHPRNLLLQEAICNLQEVRLSLYKITIEEAERDEYSNDCQDAIGEALEVYLDQNLPADQIWANTNEQATALLDPPHVTAASERYVLHELRQATARLAHIDFNLKAIHVLDRAASN